MLKRFLLALLIACLAVPAAAAPMDHSAPMAHDVSAHMQMVMGHDMNHKSQLPDEHPRQIIHGCIGCVVLAPKLNEMAKPFELPLIAPLAYIEPALFFANKSPETPPPRHG